jgi:CDP-diacylglycerol--glycerol-3-phosphate 3-phosphatidyltransferase
VSNQSFVSAAFRDRVRGIAVPVALGLGRLGLTPNGLTVIGFAGTCVAALAAAFQYWLLAGSLAIAFGIFDLLDGALARAPGKTSRVGAFLDSTLDRTGENLVYAGIAVGATAAQFPLGTALAVLALSFASVVTYARAKAEVIAVHGEVGIAPRPERLLILAIGLVLASGGQAWLALALAIIALTSAITVIQRIVHVHRQLNEGAN